MSALFDEREARGKFFLWIVTSVLPLTPPDGATELPQCQMGNRKVDNMCFMISCTNWYWTGPSAAAQRNRARRGGWRAQMLHSGVVRKSTTGLNPSRWQKEMETLSCWCWRIWFSSFLELFEFLKLMERSFWSLSISNNIRWCFKQEKQMEARTSCSRNLCFCGFYSSERITMSPFGLKLSNFISAQSQCFNTLYCDCFPADCGLDLIKEQVTQFTTLLTPTGSMKAVQ